MVALAELAAYLASLLPQRPDHTYNGLEVEGAAEVRRLLLAVSLSEDVVAEAADVGAQAVLVHHGFFGESCMEVVGPVRARLAPLLASDISLFAYHLPLDAHPVIGHNACLAGALGLEDLAPLDVGFIGRNARGLRVSEAATTLQAYLLNGEKAHWTTDRLEARGDIEGWGPRVIPCSGVAGMPGEGDRVPANILVCSGGSASLVRALSRGQADLFVLGEPSASLPREAADLGLDVICLGHWRSEQPGMWALAERLREAFPELECVFGGNPSVA